MIRVFRLLVTMSVFCLEYTIQLRIVLNPAARKHFSWNNNGSCILSSLPELTFYLQLINRTWHGLEFFFLVILVVFFFSPIYRLSSGHRSMGVTHTTHQYKYQHLGSGVSTPLLVLNGRPQEPHMGSALALKSKVETFIPGETTHGSQRGRSMVNF